MKTITDRTYSAIAAFAFACFALLPLAQAVSPAPDGGYPGGNTAEGQDALLNLTTGGFNTAVGYLSLRSNNESFNTAVGAGTLFASTGDEDTATGAGALFTNTTGGGNTANGAFALFSNTVGFFNTAVGDQALRANEGDIANSGDDNTAIGALSLLNNTVGGDNTATGFDTLRFNTIGNGNTATGSGALESNSTGSHNTGVGFGALALNSTGGGNTAVGDGALVGIQAGNFNTALGENAGQHLDQSDSNNIDIGYNVLGVAGESNTIRIGDTDITDTYIRGISGATSSGGAAVFVNGNGKLGTLTSSERFKEEIKPMDKASEVILALRPVSFRYKKNIDPAGVPQFGLVAEDVEKVNRDLVIRDAKGNPQTVRYEQINAMLLNEFLKEHKKVEGQQSKIESQATAIVELKSIVAQQQKATEILAVQLKEQAAQIQKVNAQIEESNAGLAVVANGRLKRDVRKTFQ